MTYATQCADLFPRLLRCPSVSNRSAKLRLFLDDEVKLMHWLLVIITALCRSLNKKHSFSQTECTLGLNVYMYMYVYMYEYISVSILFTDRASRRFHHCPTAVHTSHCPPQTAAPAPSSSTWLSQFVRQVHVYLQWRHLSVQCRMFGRRKEISLLTSTLMRRPSSVVCLHRATLTFPVVFAVTWQVRCRLRLRGAELIDVC